MHSLETLIRLNNQAAEKELSRKYGQAYLPEAVSYLFPTNRKRNLDSVSSRVTWRAIERDRKTIFQAYPAWVFFLVFALVPFIALFVRSLV